MKTIYAVNSGSYSDYRIDALFSTKKLAEEYMAAVPDGDYNGIEEFELDPPTADLLRRGYSVWSVHMLINGDTERVDRTDNILLSGSRARAREPLILPHGTFSFCSLDFHPTFQNQRVKISPSE